MNLVKIRKPVLVALLATFAAARAYAQSGCYTERAGTLTARSNFASGEVGGKLYITGGDTASGQTATTEMFDPAVQVWAFVASMPSVRETIGTNGAVVNGKLYV